MYFPSIGHLGREIDTLVRDLKVLNSINWITNIVDDPGPKPNCFFVSTIVFLYLHLVKDALRMGVALAPWSRHVLARSSFNQSRNLHFYAKRGDNWGLWSGREDYRRPLPM